MQRSTLCSLTAAAVALVVLSTSGVQAVTVVGDCSKVVNVTDGVSQTLGYNYTLAEVTKSCNWTSNGTIIAYNYDIDTMNQTPDNVTFNQGSKLCLSRSCILPGKLNGTCKDATAGKTVTLLNDTTVYNLTQQCGAASTANLTTLNSGLNLTALSADKYLLFKGGLVCIPTSCNVGNATSPPPTFSTTATTSSPPATPSPTSTPSPTPAPTEACPANIGVNNVGCGNKGENNVGNFNWGSNNVGNNNTGNYNNGSNNRGNCNKGSNNEGDGFVGDGNRQGVGPNLACSSLPQ